MGQPAAKLGDQVVAQDMHIVVMPPGSVPPTAPQPFPFNGMISGGCSTNVNIMGKPAAVVGSTAVNNPPHIPPPPPMTFQKPPDNQATIQMGSQTVNINGKPAARMNDMAMTCNDLPPPQNGKVLVSGATVFIG